jgi:hypothetical protein
MWPANKVAVQMALHKVQNTDSAALTSRASNPVGLQSFQTKGTARRTVALKKKKCIC